MAIECPACHSELDPSNTHCPVCLRPRTRKEMLEGLKPARQAGGRRLWRWGLAFGALAAAPLGFYYWRATARGPIATEAPPAQTAPEPAPAPAVLPPPVATTATVAVVAPPPAIALPSQTQPEPPREPRHRPTRAAARAWSVKGQVYDLLSLKPVAGARIVFQDKGSGRAVSAQTDARGRYRVALPKDAEGYEVSVSRRGYSGNFLEEMTPRYRGQSRERRLETIQELSGSSVLHVPLLPASDQTDVDYDMVLFPRQ